MESKNPKSSNCANELNKLLVEQPIKSSYCSHNGSNSRETGEEKINKGALEPEKEKDSLLCVQHKAEHKTILYMSPFRALYIFFLLEKKVV